jgi:hypothetical protein
MLRMTFSLILLMLVTAIAVSGQNDPMVAVQKSHIDANVPDEKDFDRILQRDITTYVTDRGDKGITVKMELLRNGPTQSGVAFPKFYIWIEKRDAKGNIVEEAAARIAAIERRRFDVIQYYKRSRILAEPELMQKVFPADVYERILTKLNGTSSEK